MINYDENTKVNSDNRKTGVRRLNECYGKLFPPSFREIARRNPLKSFQEFMTGLPVFGFSSKKHSYFLLLVMKISDEHRKSIWRLKIFYLTMGVPLERKHI